jgi:hypothetical protein
MTMKLRETARLEAIREEALKGWRKSLKDSEKQVAKIGGKFGDTMEHAREGQSGDAALLRIVLDCDKAIRELWGLDDPVKKDISGTIDVNHEHSGSITVDERRTRLLGILHSIGERGGIGGDRTIVDAESTSVDPARVPPPADDRRNGGAAPA